MTLSVKLNKRKALIAAPLALLLLAGAAFAAWFFFGSGSTQFQNDADVTVTVSAVPTSGSVLPGGFADLQAKITHDAGQTLYIVEANTDNPTVSSNEASCPQAYWNPAAPQQSNAGAAVPSGATGLTIDMDDALELAADAPEACADSLVTIPVNVQLSTTP